jgi:16S rRNA (guanine966-N2)-methyltransferase
MKDRVREAVFNLLGASVQSKFVIDLFAGTGAMAWESLSRGAARALLIERRFPTARLIRENACRLGLNEQIAVVSGDAFIWAKRPTVPHHPPWLVFVCPPYDFFVNRTSEILCLLDDLLGAAPAESVFALESDERFDLSLLPDAGSWDIRRYPPAVIAILERNYGRPER